MNPDSAGKTVELDTVLETLMKEQGFEHKMVEQKVFSAWERAVGKLIARNTQPVSLVKSKLTVHALSHPLVTELTLLRRDIIQKLNAEIGRAAVGELRFQIKPQRSSLRPKSQRPRRSHRRRGPSGVLASTSRWTRAADCCWTWPPVPGARPPSMWWLRTALPGS